MHFFLRISRNEVEIINFIIICVSMSEFWHEIYVSTGVTGTGVSEVQSFFLVEVWVNYNLLEL